MSGKKSKGSSGETKVKSIKRKGAAKIVSEKDTSENPLLKIEDGNEFVIITGNFLNDPYILIYRDYENFDPMIDPQMGVPGGLDLEKTDEASDMLVIIRYYDYVVVAKFKVRHILPVWMEGMRTGDMSINDIMLSIRHRLIMELQLHVPSFDSINEMDVHTNYKVRYVSPDMVVSRKKNTSDVEQSKLPI